MILGRILVDHAVFLDIGHKSLDQVRTQLVVCHPAQDDKRFVVMASKQSTTLIILAPSGISSDFRPNGYPDPSIRSWW